MVYISKLKIITFCSHKVKEKAKKLPYFNVIVKNTKKSGLCKIYKEKDIQEKLCLACKYGHLERVIITRPYIYSIFMQVFYYF